MRTESRRGVLAVDLGSSSVRAARFDEAGVPVGPLIRRTYGFRTAGTVPAAQVARLLREVLLEAHDAGLTDGVSDIAVASLWHSLMPVDDGDRPLADALTWESPEAAGTLPSLRAVLAPDGDLEPFRARTGSYVHESYPLAAYWFWRSRGLAPARWTDLPGWVIRQVLGAPVAWSAQIAAGSAMWEQSLDWWDEQTLRLVGLPVGDLGEIWREPVELVGERARSVGLDGVRLHPVLGDGYCSSLGVSATGPSVSALTAGTSGSLRVILPRVMTSVPFGIWRYRLGEAITGLGGAISGCGNVVEWVQRELGVRDPLAFVSEADPPPRDGLAAVPHLAGERGPGYRASAAGGISGLRLRHGHVDIARELMLGVGATFGAMADLFRSAVPSLERFVATGGVVARSSAFAQLLADSTRSLVEVSAISESTLRGAAMHVLGLDDLPSPAPLRVCEPRPSWARAIRERAELDPGVVPASAP